MNGRFLAARPTGVQRVAHELVIRLADRAPVTLRVPRGCAIPERLRPRVEVDEGRLGGVAWEQLELPARARGDHLGVDPANAGPVWGGPRVLLLHDVLPLSHPHVYTPSFRRWFRLVVARSARRAAVVVMFSEWGRREAIRRLGLDPARTAVIGQGVEPFDGPATPEAVRETLRRFALETPFILALGDADPRKNAAFLETVFRGLPDSVHAPRPPLVLVGSAYPHVQAPGPGRHGDHGGAVRRLGHVTDAELRALYTAARVFCFPSLAEGFGRPPLEAMACGAPVLAAGYGSAAEILGGAARVLPLDVDAWRRALRTLLHDDAAAATAAEAGRLHAARFRWDAATDALLEVCRRAGREG